MMHGMLHVTSGEQRDLFLRLNYIDKLLYYVQQGTKKLTSSFLKDTEGCYIK